TDYINNTCIMNFLRKIILLFVACFLFSLTAFGQADKNISIVPRPVSMETGEGSFTVDLKTAIAADTTKTGIRNVASQLKQQIDGATGFSVEIIRNSEQPNAENIISLSIDSPKKPADNLEGYQLSVTENKVNIVAPMSDGLFYGMQTLLQLLPAQIYHTDYTLVPQNTKWTIPAVDITDSPRFKYRGMHLDVGRHFFGVDFIKRYIDLLAMHKMNRFHWHLTEDQGWRIEIKQYPKLTNVGAWRDSTLVGHYGSDRYNNNHYGGYYTQDEIREVVAYAKKKHITIIPEIEMPGHASAALAAYPELGCKEN